MAKKDDDIAKLVRHIRRMIWSENANEKTRPRPDAFSILVRGMILIDEALEYVIDAYSVLGYKKLADTLGHLSIFQKAHLACALGAITQGELTCVQAINGLRNRVAHQMDIEVTPAQENELVKIFKSQTKLFQGLNYIPEGYPVTLVFLLLALTFSLRLRTSRPTAKIIHVQDDTNVEHIAAIAITTGIIDVMKQNLENKEDALRAIFVKKIDEAKELRDKQPPPAEPPA